MRSSISGEPLEWTIADDLSQHLPDLQNAELPDVDFHLVLLHEFGHWIAALRSDLHVEALGLFGLEHRANGSVIVTRGGIVTFASARCGNHREFAVASVGGIVAEKLAIDERFEFSNSISLMATDDLIHDKREAMRYLACAGVNISDPKRLEAELRRTMETAKALILPGLSNLKQQVRLLEQRVSEERRDKLELEGTAVHHALLTGEDLSYYEDPYGDRS
jgi:hypothetical protein